MPHEIELTHAAVDVDFGADDILETVEVNDTLVPPSFAPAEAPVSSSPYAAIAEARFGRDANQQFWPPLDIDLSWLADEDTTPINLHTAETVRPPAAS